MFYSIPVSHLSALVDEQDAQTVLRHKWYLHPVRQKRRNWYAFASVGRKTVYMHRLVLGAQSGIQVDHIDGDGLNNRRSNLRLCTQSQNNAAKLLDDDALRGIFFDRERGMYRGRVWVNGKSITTGRYLTAEEAASARDALASLHYGEFARLNSSAESA